MHHIVFQRGDQKALVTHLFKEFDCDNRPIEPRAMDPTKQHILGESTGWVAVTLNVFWSWCRIPLPAPLEGVLDHICTSHNLVCSRSSSGTGAEEQQDQLVGYEGAQRWQQERRSRLDWQSTRHVRGLNDLAVLYEKGRVHGSDAIPLRERESRDRRQNQVLNN